MKKIAIVCDGGGMKCVYLAGVLEALVKELKFTDPDIIVGSSGGISFAYYVSRQYDSFKNIWINLLTTKKFMSHIRLRRIMDIDYMVDVVFKKQDPLKVEVILHSKIKFFLNVTNCQTGESEYLSNNGESDIFEIMRATTAVPFFYNKKVKINGQNYVDGQISSSLSKNAQKAITEGAEKILMIHYNPEGSFSFISKIFWKTCSWFAGKQLRNTINKYIDGEYNVSISSCISIYHIRPEGVLPISSMDNNEMHLRKTFDLGYAKVIQNKESLLEFIYS